VYRTKRLPGKEYYQDLHSTSPHRVTMILVLFFPFGDKMWGVAIMRDFTVTAKVGENTRTRVSLREYYEYSFFLRKDVFNAIWYGGLLAQQLAIDIAMQMREHTMEFYESEQQQIKFKRDSYKALTDYCNTKAQRQASSRDKIVFFTLNSISSY
jgi:hypothetical protein